MSSSSLLHVLDWTCEDVSEWLDKRGYNKYVVTFKDHLIDGKALLLINEVDLRSPPLEIRVSNYLTVSFLRLNML